MKVVNILRVTLDWPTMCDSDSSMNNHKKEEGMSCKYVSVTNDSVLVFFQVNKIFFVSLCSLTIFFLFTYYTRVSIFKHLNPF